jgi:hypothetical protein
LEVFVIINSFFFLHVAENCASGYKVSHKLISANFRRLFLVRALFERLGFLKQYMLSLIRRPNSLSLLKPESSSMTNVMLNEPSASMLLQKLHQNSDALLAGTLSYPWYKTRLPSFIFVFFVCSSAFLSNWSLWITHNGILHSVRLPGVDIVDW